jgi:hypothetical protein
MEAILSFEMLGFIQSKLCNNPDDYNLHNRHGVNRKSNNSARV